MALVAGRTLTLKVGDVTVALAPRDTISVGVDEHPKVRLEVVSIDLHPEPSSEPDREEGFAAEDLAAAEELAAELVMSAETYDDETRLVKADDLVKLLGYLTAAQAHLESR